MGFAALWIAFLHATMWFSFPVLQVFKQTGYCGVDLFMFLSSFGLYYSYKHGGKGYLPFICRRLKRILPAYMLVGLVRSLVFRETIADMLLRLSTLSFWLKGDTSMWFIAAILPLYLLSPLYLKYFGNNREEKMTAAGFTIGLLLGVIFRYYKQNVFFFRLSVFFLGFLAGKYSDEKKPVSRQTLIGGTVLMVVALFIAVAGQLSGVELETVHLGWAIFWLPAMFFTWPLAFWLAVLFEKTGSFTVFASLGNVSLEFYLLFELMIFIGDRIITIPAPFDYHGIIFNVLIMIVTYGISCLLLKGEKIILRRQ